MWVPSVTPGIIGVLFRGRGMTDPVGPRPHLAGRRVVLLIEARGLPTAEVCHKPPHQNVTESGVVDHLDKKAVRDSIECLRDIHSYGHCTARDLRLLKTNTNKVEMRNRAEKVECLVLKPC